MKKSWLARNSVGEHLFSFGTLAIVLFFIYAQFVLLPYVGFNWTSNVVTRVYVPSPDLQEGDRLEQIAGMPMSQFGATWNFSPLETLKKGDTLKLQIKRATEAPREINWVLPGPTPNQIGARLENQWWLAFAFWVIGQITLSVLRPRDVRWRLLIAFNFLTAIWLVAGGVSRWHIGYGLYVVCGAMWLSAPVYLQLHWEFPQPLRRLPSAVFPGLYLLSALGMVANWLQLIPTNSYSLPITLAALASVVILVIRFFRRPAERSEVRLLLIGGLVAFVPLTFLGFLYSLGGVTNFGVIVLVFALPLFPLTYFYAAYRKQLGVHELRANRAFTAYVFFILLAGLISLVVFVVQLAFDFAAEESVLGIGVALSASGLSAFGWPRFASFFERRAFGVKLPSEALIATYVNHLASKLDLPSVANVLREEILPTLLIKQSVLLRLGNDTVTPLYRQGVEANALPELTELPELLKSAGHYRAELDGLSHLVWVKVVLPLKMEGQLLGVWLLGRRDPDDFYSQREIDVLQSLAHQTAIAVVHAMQTDRLQVLYRQNVEQHERDRITLARELHDDVLNRIPPLLIGLSNQLPVEILSQHITDISQRIRQITTSLRPGISNLGIYLALKSLSDGLKDRVPAGLTCVFEVTGDEVRYDPMMEQHLYRIVQQACDNALRHAQAHTLRIYGELKAERLDLYISDDGVGFPNAKHLDLNLLLANKHFGMANMFERAEIIQATLEIETPAPGGTTLHLKWRRTP